MDCEHATIVKKFKEKVNVIIRRPLERQPIKKRMNVLKNAKSKFFL